MAPIHLNSIYQSVLRSLVNDDPEQLAKYIKKPQEKPPFLWKPFLKEKSLLDRAKRRNLLHLAVLHAASRCVTMLVESPYLWDPDIPDANGWTAMQMAEALNNIHIMYPLARVSRELRHMEPVVSRKNNQLTTTHLFWPQDLMTGAFISPYADCSRRVVMLQFSPEMPWRLSGRLPTFSGRDLALLFELLLADHPLICRDLECPLVLPLTIWPICNSSMLNHVGHMPNCEDYPNCLLTQWLRTNRSGGSLSLCYQETISVWKLHRFGWLHPDGGTPLSLKEHCRICFRRQVTNCIKPAFVDTQANIYPNYARILMQFNLPSMLVDFLLYREFWPVEKSIPERFLAEPVSKRGCYHIWTEQFGVGIRIEHGFIPDNKQV
ncbi:unnamed protein product [Fasciola hepatica]|uniref:Uncharacterized protein n=2 Tax=Fasciola hepatica TaxID=6192 RepID=A0ABC9HHJ8_FASHE|nr:hypothetical protein D915_007986 [Fasciola hepatica]